MVWLLPRRVGRVLAARCAAAAMRGDQGEDFIFLAHEGKPSRRLVRTLLHTLSQVESLHESPNHEAIDGGAIYDQRSPE